MDQVENAGPVSVVFLGNKKARTSRLNGFIGSHWHLGTHTHCIYIPIGSMYGIYANIGGILMVNVTIYGIHGSYGIANPRMSSDTSKKGPETVQGWLHISCDSSHGGKTMRPPVTGTG